MQNLIFNNMLN